ncbi:MAG: GIY-YIG nuclease family protein [Dehalococcoidia bacterium]|nr:GIY-YIG nuclease family protein [Dehalococcoidia bacterium]
MSIDASFHSFTDAEINNATILDGVYALYDGSETIYIGKGEGAEGIRGRLKRHKAGYEGNCTKQATYFNYETNFNPLKRESELLQEYKRLWGKLPRCNEVMPDKSTWA